MKLKHIAPFLIITLLLAACASAKTAPPVVTENSTAPPTKASVPTQPVTATKPVPTTPPTPYPAPSLAAQPTTAAYPAPGSTGTGPTTIPPSGYEPQPGDESLKRDKVTLDMEGSSIEVTASDPADVKVVLTGTLSDPCHYLRAVVTPAGSGDMIDIEVYSLVNPATACVTRIEPFTAVIPLGTYSSGQFTVNVNGAPLGQFITTFAPQPGDDQLTRGDVTLEMTATQLIISGTQPNQVSANLQGQLLSPCYQLRIVLTPADSSNKIVLEVYSVYDPKAACPTVIQPFQVIYPLGSFTSGHYMVYVNDQLIGEFDG